MDKKEIEIKSKKIFYRVYGNGKPVILIHGFGEDGEVWNNQVDHLKDRFTLIVPDLPGSGKSEIADDMSMEGLAATIQQMLITEKIKDCAMIGHSMGGYVALAFAEKNPDMLTALALFHSTAYADSEEKKATRRKGIEFIEEHGAFEFLESTTPNLFSPETKEKNPELVDEQINGLKSFSAAALIAYYEAMIERPDRTMVLRNSTIPILFIAGKFDNAIPLEDILKLCYLPSLSYIHILRNSGHMGMLEEPGKSNKILEDFLS